MENERKATEKQMAYIQHLRRHPGKGKPGTGPESEFSGCIPND